LSVFKLPRVVRHTIVYTLEKGNVAEVDIYFESRITMAHSQKK